MPVAGSILQDNLAYPRSASGSTHRTREGTRINLWRGYPSSLPLFSRAAASASCCTSLFFPFFSFSFFFSIFTTVLLSSSIFFRAGMRAAASYEARSCSAYNAAAAGLRACTHCALLLLPPSRASAMPHPHVQPRMRRRMDDILMLHACNLSLF